MKLAEKRDYMTEHENVTGESRPDKAVRLFKEGYNCSQAVFAAYADKYGLEPELALRLAASFGGGMGRMREVCGTVSGMCLVAGLETGATQGKDIEGKQANYDMVQALAAEFKKQNGSIICKELLGLVPRKTEEMVSGDVEAAEFTDTRPQERTEQYYKKRPCVELVRQACEILEEILFAKTS